MRPSLLFAILILALLSPPVVLAQAASGQGPVVDSCWDCHKDDQAGRDHRASIHYTFGIGCADCHGGDPTQAKREEAESESAGFKAKFSVFDIPDVCAKCHGKKKYIQWSRTKRNAFEEYKQGAHAEALWEKEEKGSPQCATCHGAHRVLRVDDPESPAYPANVNKTCAKCHASPEYEELFELDIKIPEEVAESVHGPKSAWNPDLNLPTCASCHNAHWNFRPQWKGKEIFDTCGTCHTQERSAFHSENPHFDKSVHCALCHGPHEIKPPTPALFKDPKVCASCHDAAKKPDDPALAYITRVLQAIAPVEESIKRSREVLGELAEEGFRPETEIQRVDRAERALLTNFGLVQHRLIIQRNFLELEAIAEQAKSAEASVLAIKGRARWTRVALWGGAVYLLLLGWMIWLGKRRE
jgi:hypothetical protein